MLILLGLPMLIKTIHGLEFTACNAFAERHAEQLHNLLSRLICKSPMHQAVM